MSQRIIVTCDECGTERKEANHWFSLLSSATTPKLSTFDAANKLPEGQFRLDYCGQRCMMTAIQRWFDIGTIIDPAAATGARSKWTSPAPARAAESTPHLVMAGAGR